MLCRVLYRALSSLQRRTGENCTQGVVLGVCRVLAGVVHGAVARAVAKSCTGSLCKTIQFEGTVFIQF